MNDRQPTGTAVMPVTGEVIDLGDPDGVAVWLGAMKEWKRRIAESERLLMQALSDYAERSGQPRTVTLPGGGRVIREGGPGKRLEYDAHAVERGLRDAGAPPELIARVIERVTTIRVNGTEAQKAARANPTYKQVIDAATTRVDVPYTIRLG